MFVWLVRTRAWRDGKGTMTIFMEDDARPFSDQNMDKLEGMFGKVARDGWARCAGFLDG